MAVDPIEEWLGTRLKAAYPVDDWVLEGVTSALLLLEDRADAIDTIANFLGTADAPGTNEQIVDELFRRKRRDTADAGAGETERHASEPAPSSAGPSRDASSSRARATSSSAGDGTRVDAAYETRGETKGGGERARRDAGVTKKSTPRLPTTTPRRPVRPDELAKPDVNCLRCGKIYRCAPRDGALAPETRAFLRRGCACVFCGGAVDVALADGSEMTGGLVFADDDEDVLAGPPAREATFSRNDGFSRQKKSLDAPRANALPAVSRATAKPNADAAADAAARDAKDRLVDFDRTAAARTTVIDDQSDWFEIEANAWLDEDEREEAKRQAREVAEAREAAARNRAARVTLDLLGRRVDDASARRDGDFRAADESAGSGFVLRTNSVEDIVATATNVSLVAGARPAVDADASAGPTPGAGGARAKLSPDGTVPDAGDGESDADPRRDPRRVRSNPTAGFAPAFASRAARKTKGKKGENTAFLETRGGGTERGLARRVQDESPFDVVARETEARGGETSFW